jgi:hypothetical protein
VFGKKKSVVAQVSSFHCGVCGANCFDQQSFERHVGLAHMGAETYKTVEKGELSGSEKKV